MPQVANLVLPVGAADADVTYEQIDIRDGLATWRQQDSGKGVNTLERISAVLRRPSGNRKNYIAEVRIVLPCVEVVDGIDVVTHSNYVDLKFTLANVTTVTEAQHALKVLQETLLEAPISGMIGGIAGLY